MAAVANTALVAGWGATFEVPVMITLFRPLPGPRTGGFFGLEAFLLVSFLLVLTPLAFLAWRPKWWGKLVLPLFGLSWIGHAAIIHFFLFGEGFRVAGVWVPAVCGLVMFALAIAHEVIDRRQSRAPPR